MKSGASRKSGRRAQVRAILSKLMKRLRTKGSKPSGVEFLDTRDAAYCRLGLIRWRESKERRARRARQEMRIFRLLDDAGTVAVRHGEIPDLHAWELRLANEGYECLNQRVGERGVLNVFFRDRKKAHTVSIYKALDAAAEEIESLFKR